MNEEEIILRVLFEYLTYDKGEVLPESIEGAVIRSDIQNAGGMPTLKEDLEELRQLIILRYKSVEVERRT